jgi:hypothetical protein
MAIIRPAHSLIHTRSCTGKLTRTQQDLQSVRNPIALLCIQRT